MAILIPPGKNLGGEFWDSPPKVSTTLLGIYGRMVDSFAVVPH